MDAQTKKRIKRAELSRTDVYNMIVGMSRNGALLLTSCLKMYALPKSAAKWREVLIESGCAAEREGVKGLEWVAGVEPSLTLADEICQRYEGTYVEPEAVPAPDPAAESSPALERIERKLDLLLKELGVKV